MSRVVTALAFLCGGAGLLVATFTSVRAGNIVAGTMQLGLAFLFVLVASFLWHSRKDN